MINLSWLRKTGQLYLIAGNTLEQVADPPSDKYVAL